MSNRMYRLPIHHEDSIFHDQTERMFRDMQLRMDHGFPAQRWPELQSSSATTTWPRSESLARPSRVDSFFQLKPRQIPIQQVGGASREVGGASRDVGGASEHRGSREVLDDATIGNLFLEDPQTKSRMFRMSFDVSKYEPKDVQVTMFYRCF